MNHAAQDPRPNILVIVPHDLGDWLGCYGYDSVRSPNLDAFASRGVRLSNCFCASPECSPSRASLFTGQPPHASGMLGLSNFGWSLRVPHLAQRLGDAGYDTHLFGFQHETAEPVTQLGYAHHHRGTRDDGTPTNDARAVCNTLSHFLQEQPADDTPWFGCVGFSHTHRPWPEATSFSPDSVTLPAYVPDLPEVRADTACFHQSIAEMDTAVGQALATLSASAHAANTLVVFTSDHGAPFPRAKATVYDPGLRVAMLMHWPGVVEGGHVLDQLLSNVDVTPTLLDLIGCDVPVGLSGRSFAPLLRGEAYEQRDAVFGSVVYDVAYDPVHCVRTRDWKYIRSFAVTPEDAIGADPRVLATHVAGQWVRVDDYDVLSSPTWQAMASPQSKPPREELYDLRQDPLEQHNLADDGGARPALDAMRDRLAQWMDATGSPFGAGHVPPPPEQVDANRRYRPGGPMW